MNGNLTLKTNKVTGAKQEYSWSAENRITQAKAFKNTSSLHFTISYKYDPSGRRIERAVTNHLEPAKSYTQRFVYDGQHILAVLDENNELVAGYLYDEGVDQPVLMVTDYDQDGELDVLALIRDRQNSVKIIANSDREVIQEISYSAYGETQIINRGQLKHNFRNLFYYTSRELEQELGIYYYRARYYDPTVGRFLSEDPIGFAGGDTNLYRYVENNPAKFTDPSGNFGVIAAIVGVYVSYTAATWLATDLAKGDQGTLAKTGKWIEETWKKLTEDKKKPEPDSKPKGPGEPLACI